jgi:hypothetical protein
MMDKRELQLAKAIKDTAGSLFWIKVWVLTVVSLLLLSAVA